MRRRVAVVAVVLAVVGGCGDANERATTPPESPASSAPAPAPVATEQPVAGNHNLFIDVGGVRRNYLLHAPPGYTGTAPVPLVIAMHMYPGSGTQIRGVTNLDAKADQHNFIVAYPEGVNSGFNALVCCGTADDVAFLTTLTRHLVDRWRADPDRVYLTGMSNGADMSFRGAVEASGTFAAIGVVSGGYGGPRTEAADYVPTSPVSVVTIIGKRDRYFPIFESGLAAWQQRLRCTPVPQPAPAPVIRTVARCADGSDVDVYVVPEMGHIWPTGESFAPLIATDIVWDFFAAHPRKR